MLMMLITTLSGVGHLQMLPKNSDFLCDKVLQEMQYGPVMPHFVESNPVARGHTSPFLDLGVIRARCKREYEEADAKYKEVLREGRSSLIVRSARHEAQFLRTHYEAMMAK